MRIITRTLSILSTLGRYPQGVGVTDLAKAVNLPVGSLHRTLKVLAKHNVVWQNPTTRAYSLGLGLLELSLPMLEHHVSALRQSALAPLTDLAERTRSQVYMSVLAQDTVVGIETVRPSRGQRVHVISHDPRTVPFHCGAAAKAILAFLPSAAADSLIRRCTFRPYTMYTILSPDDLWPQLDQARRQGYATCEEEFEIGVTALAVPILDRQGRAFASLGLCAPAPRMDEKFRQRVSRQLSQSAAVIAKQFGRTSQQWAQTNARFQH
jgi:IclR family acetate operon transcriptional repressor